MSALKATRRAAITLGVSALGRPIADRVTVWPLERGRFGVDATFQGASGMPVAEAHEASLRERGARVALRQELDEAGRAG